MVDRVPQWTAFVLLGTFAFQGSALPAPWVPGFRIAAAIASLPVLVCATTGRWVLSSGISFIGWCVGWGGYIAFKFFPDTIGLSAALLYPAVAVLATWAWTRRQGRVTRWWPRTPPYGENLYYHGTRWSSTTRKR